MNGGHEALFRVDPSPYDAWHSAKTAGAASSRCNAGSSTQDGKISITGCLGTAERIFR